MAKGQDNFTTETIPASVVQILRLTTSMKQISGLSIQILYVVQRAHGGLIDRVHPSMYAVLRTGLKDLVIAFDIRCLMQYEH